MEAQTELLPGEEILKPGLSKEEIMGKIRSRLNQFVPAGVTYYKDIRDVPPSHQGPNTPEEIEKRNPTLVRNRRESPDTLEQKGRFLRIAPLDPDNPDDKNVAEIDGRGFYVKVFKSEKDGSVVQRWVPYNEPARKGRKSRYRYA